MRTLIAALCLCLPLVSLAGPAPDFALRDLANKEQRLSEQTSKVVVVTFFASWCEKCGTELPLLQKIYSEIPRDDLEILAISIDDARNASKVKPFVKQRGVTYPVLKDKDSSVIVKYNPQKTVPYIVLLNAEREIVWTHSGFERKDADAVRAAIDEAIAGS